MNDKTKKISSLINSYKGITFQEFKEALEALGFEISECEGENWYVIKVIHNNKENLLYVCLTTESDEEAIQDANEKYKDAHITQFTSNSSLCIMTDSNGKYNLCRTKEDRRPIYKEWFDNYGLAGEDESKRYLKRIIRDDLPNYEAECYPINPDGTLGKMLYVKEQKSIILENQRNVELIEKNLRKNGFPENVIKNMIKPEYYFSNEKWKVKNSSTWFVIHCKNKKIGVIFKLGEVLKQIHFDPEKKTIKLERESLKRPNAPGVIDLSEDPKFFDELRNKIEEILLTCNFSAVTSNETRTIFKVK